MKNLAVISDIHDNLINLQKALDYIKKAKADYLICTGDVQSLEAWLSIDQLNIPVWAVMGNVDKDILGAQTIKNNLKNINFSPNVGSVTLEEKNILFCHYPELVKKIIANYPNKYQLALAGHTHCPWEETIGSTKLLNPGNIANLYYPPSFAMINLADLKAKLILLNEL